jgi:hypothetical protein
MANVLTDLASDIFVAAEVVGRELTGASSSVTINANGSERVGLGGVVRSAFTRDAVAVNVVPSMTIPEGTDQTVDNKTATITKSRAVQIPWAGEDVQNVNNGAGFSTIYGSQIAQAMRTLSNEVEVDLCTEIYQNASRAVGTAATTPFASNFDLVAESRQILVDNGCPVDQITMVMNTLAGTKLRNLAQLQKANESNSDALLRQGVLLDLQGIGLKESAQIQSHTKGTGTSYTSDTAGYAIGATEITLITGSGTVVAGDVVTFAGDANKYVVASGAPGGLTLAAPGLRAALPASAVAMTVGASYTGNIVFRRSAVELIMRPPALPQGGDVADDSMIVQDPSSGLVFEIRSYKGYKKAMLEVSLAWGVKAWEPKHIAGILG